MKKLALIYGLIGGLIIGAAMIIPFHLAEDVYNMDNAAVGQVVGFSLMFIGSILAIHLGVRHIRNKDLNGIISYWRAFQSGVLISLFASIMYLFVVWLGFYKVYPDWADKYADNQISKVEQNTELTTEEKTETIVYINSNREWPLIAHAAIEASTILIFGLLISFVSAALLKRKEEGVPTV